MHVNKVSRVRTIDLVAKDLDEPEDHWVVRAIGAPHIGERSEKEMLRPIPHAG